MTRLTVHYRGQLATAAGTNSEIISVVPGKSLRDLIVGLAEARGGEFSSIVVDAEGNPRRSLLVAVNGEQVLDLAAPVTADTGEITLMPPIAGG